MASDPAFNMIFEASLQDKEYLAAASALEQDEAPRPPFQDPWDELSVIKSRSSKGAMIVHGQKIVVPKPAQLEILQRLHLPHSGQVKTLAQAHQLYYWKGMAGNIQQMVASCVPCREHLPSKACEPSRELLTANAPLEAISMDLFYTGGAPPSRCRQQVFGIPVGLHPPETGPQGRDPVPAEAHELVPVPKVGV